MKKPRKVAYLQATLTPEIQQRFKNRARSQFRSMTECITVLAEKYADGEIILEKNLNISVRPSKIE